MAFPGILLVVNISFYFIAGLYFKTLRSYKKFSRKLNTGIPFWALLFAVGSIISVLNIPGGWGSANFRLSLSALPNYIYWSLIIVFLNRYRGIIDYQKVKKYIFLGTTLYIPFYFLRENFLTGIPIFQKTSPNNLAFLMVCYSSVSISYVKANKSMFYTLLYFAGILALMLFLGRRAGFALVLISGLLTILVNKVNLKKAVFYGFGLFTLILISQLPFVEGLVKSANPRIYQLAYQREQLIQEDRSYLTRVAMAEKGIYLFKNYPVSGVGIINFHRTEGVIGGDFTGSRYVVNKAEINELSAHNSYISVLSEGGLVLFIPWIMILLSVLIKFIVNIKKIEHEYYPLFWGFFGMIIHYSSIVGYVNVYSWFLLALCCVILGRKGEKNINQQG